MKNRAKWIALTMYGILLLGGCGMTGEPQSDVDNHTTEDMIVTDATDTMDETVATNVVAPAISIASDTREWFMEGTDVRLLEVDYSIVTVESQGFDALKAALEERFGGVDEQTYEGMLEEAKEDYEFREEADREYFYGYYSSETAELMRSDSAVLSLRVVCSDYFGGAHGMYAVYGETFDVESGKILEFADILKDAEGFYPKATAYISANLYEEYGENLVTNYEEYVAGTFEEGRNICWYLNAAGIVVAYTPYEIGPYAMGAPEILLPYEEFGDYIHEKYLHVPNGEVIASVPMNQNIAQLIGESESIRIEADVDEWEMSTVKVVSASSTGELGSFGNILDSYVIKRADGRSFLLVVGDYMSDDYVTFVYEVTGGMLKKCCELPGAAVNGEYLAADKISMRTTLYVLGTYMANMDYILDEEGQLIQAEDIYTIEMANPMTVIKELPVIIDGAEATLGVGTEIAVTGANKVDEVYFRVIGSEQKGTIRYQKDEENWLHLIDGISEYEYFDNIPYAG